VIQSWGELAISHFPPLPSFLPSTSSGPSATSSGASVRSRSARGTAGRAADSLLPSAPAGGARAKFLEITLKVIPRIPETTRAVRSLLAEKT
jgi:hypothetical protein